MVRAEVMTEWLILWGLIAALLFLAVTMIRAARKSAAPAIEGGLGAMSGAAPLANLPGGRQAAHAGSEGIEVA